MPAHLLCANSLLHVKKNANWMSEMEYKLLRMFINPSALGKVLPQLVPDGFIYLRHATPIHALAWRTLARYAHHTPHRLRFSFTPSRPLLTHHALLGHHRTPPRTCYARLHDKQRIMGAASQYSSAFAAPYCQRHITLQYLEVRARTDWPMRCTLVRQLGSWEVTS